MRIGLHVDGQPIDYDETSQVFSVGTAAVTRAQVLEYDRAGQLTWDTPDLRDWFYGPAVEVEPIAAGSVSDRQTYCANCGQQTAKRVCETCGARSTRATRFCMHCGHSLAESAVKCVGCGKRVYRGLNPILAVTWWLAAVAYLVLGVSFAVTQSNPVGALTLVGAGLFFVPPVFRYMVNLVTRHNRTANVVVAVTYFLVLITLLGVLALNAEFVFDDRAAQNYAASVVQSSLKNPDSLIVNEYAIYYLEPAQLDDPANRYIEMVALMDISAQIPLGGFTRQDVTVSFVWDRETNEFSGGYAEFEK